MPRTYKRNCDHCGTYYEGYGKKYCSPECVGGAQTERADMDTATLPERPSNRIEDETKDGQRTVRVLASDTIRTADQLLDAASVDTEAWEPAHQKVKKWDVAMKLKDGEGGQEAVAIELFYVEVLLRPTAEALFNLQPTRLDIHAPKTPKPNGRGVRHSVHYSDLHIPFHDPRCRSILLQVMERVRPETVIDHGDTGDCHDISRYEKDPHNRVPLDAEVEMIARHHGEVHALTPDAEHLWFLGNHEARLQTLIWKLAENRAAGEILTLPGVTEALRWENLTGVGELGWEVIPYPEHRVFKDRLILIHGNTARKHSAYSAKDEYGRYGKSGMSGHTHRRGVYEHRDFNGWHAWWEMGLLGKIRNDYTAFADWQQGFNVVTWTDDYTRFNVEEVRIHDGVTCFRGETIEGDPADTLTANTEAMAA